ncbi:MAG: hypothetical protein M3220_04040, partial [Chloroflexota bacterium]|nr:hypothetical protein [Chloroflexota bacterium]
MKQRTSTRVALVLWAIFLILQVVALWLAFLTHPLEEPGSSVMPLLSRNLVFLPAIAAFPTIGAVVAARRPRNPIGWLFISLGLLAVSGQVAEGYWRYALLLHPGSLPFGELMLWIGNKPYELNIIPMMLMFLLFPTGRPPSPRWWWAGGAVIVGVLLALLGAAFQPGPIVPGVPFENPFALPTATSVLRWMEELGSLLMLGGVLAVVTSLIVRLRRARGVERQQIKWAAYGMALTALSFVAVGYGIAINSSDIERVAFIVWALATALAAVAVGIAIQRYRLYDIDLIIRRTLIYTFLTVALAVFYLGSVVLLQQLFRSLTGQDSNAAIVISTLTIAALF